MIAQDKNRIFVLDSLRGICACLVVLFHLSKGSSGFFGTSSLIQNSWMMVDFFFVLSGAAIGLSSFSRLANGDSIRSFLVKRIGRIAPLYFFVLALMAGIELIRYGLGRGNAFGPGHSISELVASVFFLSSFGLHDGLSWNWPSWSVAAELWVYLLFAIIASAARWRSPIMFFGLASLALICLRLANNNDLNVTFDFGFFRCLYGFSLGILIVPLVLDRRARNPGGNLEKGFASIVALAAVSLSSGVMTMMMPVVFSAVIIAFSRDGGAISTLLTHPLFGRLGAWSFSIYMIQGLIQQSATKAFKWLGEILNVAIVAPVPGQSMPAIVAAPLAADFLIVAVLLIVVACSSVTYRWIEMPAKAYVYRLAERLGNQRRDIPTGASPVAQHR